MNLRCGVWTLSALFLVSGCVTQQPSTSTSTSPSSEMPPSGKVFLYPKFDKKVGEVVIWAVDGQRVEMVKSKDYGKGAVLNAGPHKIRVQLEDAVWVQGQMLTQLSLPAYFYGDRIYSANLLPSINPKAGMPSYQFWLTDETTTNLAAEGVYFKPPEK